MTTTTANPPTETLSSAELLASVNGMSYRQLDYWTRRGVITPVGAHRPGQGSYRRFPVAELPLIRILIAYRHISDSLDACYWLMAHLRSDPALLDADVLYVTADGKPTAQPPTLFDAHATIAIPKSLWEPAGRG